MNQTVFRAELQPAAVAGVAVGVLVHHAMHRGPTADIAPAEIGFDGQDFAFDAGFFQNRIVDGDARHLVILARDDGAQGGLGLASDFPAAALAIAAKRRADVRLIAIQQTPAAWRPSRQRCRCSTASLGELIFAPLTALGFSVKLFDLERAAGRRELCRFS